MNQALFNVNLGQMEIFFTVVEQESFTKAGVLLNMTQSAVSKNIAKLEQETDLQLFTRRYREICVTEAGKQLYHYWKSQADKMSDAYETIWKLQHAADNQLKVGVTNTTDLDTYFWPLISEFQNKFPEAELEMDSDSMNRLVQKLVDRQLDLVFIPDFMKYKLDELGLVWQWAAQDQVQIIMPASHPLAETKLTVAAIKDEEILLLDEEYCPGNRRFLEEMFAAAGCTPNISKKHYRTPESIDSFYRIQDGLLLTDHFFRFQSSKEKMVRKPVADAVNGIICGWRKDNTSRYLKNLLRCIREASGLDGE